MQDILHPIAEDVAELIRARPDQVPAGALDSLADRLLAAQRLLNPAYAAWCAASRPGLAEDAPARLLPPVPTEAFKHAAFSCIPTGLHTFELHSSGTTAQIPSRHLHHGDSLALYQASALRGFESRFLPGNAASLARHPHERTEPLAPHHLLSLTPPLHEAPRSSLVHMMHWVIQRHGARGSTFLGRRGSDGSWEVDIDSTVAALEGACAQKLPVILMGTAFNVVHLLDALEARRASLVLPAGSRLMETGGYKGRSRELSREELHQAASQALGIPAKDIVTEYGMTELSSQAYDLPASPDVPSPATRGILRFPHWARARVVCPGTGHEVADGERGIVEVLDLANVWSVAWIRTSDMAIRHRDGFQLIGRAVAAEPRGCSRMTA